MNEHRHKAQHLRKQGYSYSLIHERTGVAKSTLSSWFREIPYTPNEEVKERIRNGPKISARKRQQQRLDETKEIHNIAGDEIGKLSKRDLLLLGIGVYIGEGSKSVENVRITNSDPSVICFSIRWLRECCGLKLDNILIRMFLYPDNDHGDALRYWQRTTKLPLASFRKTIIDRRINKSSANINKLPYGTVQLSVVCRGDAEKGVRLHRKITGWMNSALSQV